MDLTRIVEYCADEVERQGDGPRAVGNMFRAWDYIVDNYAGNRYFDEDNLRKIAALVNGQGGYMSYRLGPAVFNQGSPALDAQHIERQLGILFAHMLTITPDEFCKRLLEIHPFEDGNGRVASLMYNWLRGSIMIPSSLPMYEFV